MPKTECLIDFGLYDVTALDDAVYKAENIQVFSSLENLTQEYFEIPRISSLEPSQTLLDGSFVNLPQENPGLWSEFPSNRDGLYGYSVDAGPDWDEIDALKISWEETDALKRTWDEIDGGIHTWDEFDATDSSWNDYDILGLAWDELADYFDGKLSTLMPTFEILFSEDHSSSGLTFHFSPQHDEWASFMTVYWYNRIDELVGYGRYEPDSANYFAEQKASSFRRIRVEIGGTNKPYRYFKLSRIDFGSLERLTGADMISATIHEEINPVSAQVFINTLSCKIHSSAANFFVLNPSGAYAFLQNRQRLSASARVDDRIIPMGTFFLDGVENESKAVASLKAIDLMGIIDKSTFDGGIYTNKPVGELVEEIMASAGAGYELYPALEHEVVSGHIPICSHREALQQVAFAVGAIATCSRNEKIIIFPQQTNPVSEIGVERKFYRSPVHLGDMVTGVTVVSHEYKKGLGREELLNEVLAEGEHIITFNNPVHDIEIEGGELLEFNANLAKIYVPQLGAVIATGIYYEERTREFSRTTPYLPSSTLPNVERVENATLVSPSIARQVALRLYNHFQNRHQETFATMPTDEIVSDMAVVNHVDGGQILGTIKSMDVDLTGGFIAQMNVDFASLIQYSSAYYAGELFAGEEFGDL